MDLQNEKKICPKKELSSLKLDLVIQVVLRQIFSGLFKIVSLSPAKQGTLTSDITLPVCESKFSVTETISKMLAQAEKTCLIKVEDMLKAESFAKTFALLKKKKAV